LIQLDLHSNCFKEEIDFKKELTILKQTMNRYTKGKIYRLLCEESNLCYIGSTYKDLAVRLCKHKDRYKRWLKNDKDPLKYLSFFDLFILGEVWIDLIEDYPCEDRNALCRREGSWIKKHLDKCVNKYAENQSIIRAKAKKRYEENKKEILTKNKAYAVKNKEKIRKQTHDRNCKKVECECGSIVAHGHITGHKRSDKHRLFLDPAYVPPTRVTQDQVECDCGAWVVPSTGTSHSRSKRHQEYLKTNIKKPPNKPFAKCECGWMISQGCLSRHKRSAVHKKRMPKE
jgi:hypothetical protein